MHQLVLEWIVLDCRPFSVVEDEGFKAIFAALGLPVPGRMSMQKKLDEMDKKEVTRIAAMLQQSCEYLSLTTDAWKADSNDHYVAVTGHWLTPEFQLQTQCLGVLLSNKSHTAQQICDDLTEVLANLRPAPAGPAPAGVQAPAPAGVQAPGPKVTGITHDNGANFVAGVTDFLRLNGGHDMRCVSHTVQLAVESTVEQMPAVKELLKKMKKLVKNITRSHFSQDLRTRAATAGSRVT